MHLEAASIGPERIQYHPAGPPPGSGDPTSAQLPLGADWRDPITDREGFRLPGIIRIRRLGQYDETSWSCGTVATTLHESKEKWIATPQPNRSMSHRQCT